MVPIVSAISSSSSSPLPVLISKDPSPISDMCESILRQSPKEGIERCLKKAKKENFKDEELINLSKELVNRLAAVKNIPVQNIDFEYDLMGYQKEGVAWILSLANKGLGGILALSPGLGKTLQAIEFIRQRQRFGGNGHPFLIVVPNSIIEQWREELVKCLYTSRKKQIKALINRRDHLSKGGIRALCEGLEFLMLCHYKALAFTAEEAQKNAIRERIIDGEELIFQAVRNVPHIKSFLKEHWMNQTAYIVNGVERQRLVKLRNRWMAGFLIQDPIQKSTNETHKVALEFLKPAFTATLWNEIEQELNNPLLNRNGLLHILDRASSDSKWGHFDVANSLGQFLDAIAPPNIQLAMNDSEYVNNDSSLLNVNMYEQVVIISSDTIDTPKKNASMKSILNKPEMHHSWKIVLTSESALTIKNRSNSDQDPHKTGKHCIISALKELPWDSVISDEAHEGVWDILKNRDKIASHLTFLKTFMDPEKVPIISLTGTPYVNTYRETWSLIQKGNPCLSLTKFVAALTEIEMRCSKAIEEFLKSYENEGPNQKLIEEAVITGIQDSIIAYRYASWIHNQLIFVRTMNDSQVRNDWTDANGIVRLPEQVLRQITCRPNSVQNKLIDKICKHAKDNFKLHDAVSKILFHPRLYGEWNLKEKELKSRFQTYTIKDLNKLIRESGFLNAFLEGEELNQAIKEGKSILILVTQINQGILLEEILKKRFSQAGIAFLYGQTSFEDRNHMVKNFMAAIKKPQILILSQGAGGLGLDVKTAEVVFDFAPWWNSAVSRQGWGRALRAGCVGQKLIYLYHNNTLPERHAQHIVQTKDHWKKFFFDQTEDVNVRIEEFISAMKGTCLKMELSASHKDRDKELARLEKGFGEISNIMKNSNKELMEKRLKTMTSSVNKIEIDLSPSYAPPSLSSLPSPLKSTILSFSLSFSLTEAAISLKPNPSPLNPLKRKL